MFIVRFVFTLAAFFFVAGAHVESRAQEAASARPLQQQRMSQQRLGQPLNSRNGTANARSNWIGNDLDVIRVPVVTPIFGVAKATPNGLVQLSFMQKVETTREEKYFVKVPFQDVRTETYTVQVPYNEKKEQIYTVQVPYVEEVEKEDGTKRKVTRTRVEKRTRVIPVTKMRSEQRTREIAVTKMRVEQRSRSLPTAENQLKKAAVHASKLQFWTLAGQPIASQAVTNRLAVERPILILKNEEPVSAYFQQLLRPDSLVLRFR